MIVFWIAAFLATAAAAGLIAVYARRPVPVLADPAQAVYRRQLEEIDDMAARGLIVEDERKSAYAEAARRLLGEAPSPEETAVGQGSAKLIAAVVAGVGIVAVGAYVWLGQPGMPDQPFQKRLAEWNRTDPSALSVPELEAVLKPRVAERNDAQGYMLLAQVQLNQDDFFSAQRNVEHALELNPNDVEAWTMLGELRLRLADNKFTPGVREALRRAVALDPKVVPPRYFLGRDAIEQGRRDEGLALWRSMLPDIPEAESRATLEKQIASVEAGGPVVPVGSGNANAPSGAPTDPAILAMVERLAARLKDDPNDVEGWARLVRSYAVLKNDAKLKEALAEARTRFKNRPKDLATIEGAANVPQ